MRKPLKIITQLPADFDLHPEPKNGSALRFFCFLSALALVFGALVKGAWQ